MPRCDHLGPDPGVPCPHEALAGGTTCLWHRPAVRKDAPYVRAVFRAADAASAGRFAGAHLAGIDLGGERLPGRVLRGADLRDARLDGCDLTGADLRGANLRRASLVRADLRGADLRGADLAGCRLTGADLRRADAAQALFDGTLLLGADLREANLDGARIATFQWNRMTRFQGVRGLEDPGSDDGDTTRVFLSPALFSDVDTRARAALEPDADLDATRVFAVRAPHGESAGPGTGRGLESPGRGHESLPAGTATTPAGTGALTPGGPPSREPPPPPRLRWPGVVLSSLAGAVAASTLWLGALALHGPRAADGAALAAQRIPGLEAQHAADLEQLAGRDQRIRELGRTATAAQEEGAAATARAARLDGQLQEALADVARLQQADDRAMLAGLDAAAAARTTRDLALASARQDRVARILADGVARTTEDNRQLAATLAEAQRRVAALEEVQGLQVRQARELAAAIQDRDRLQGLYDTAAKELTVARRDIDRYLNRVAGTQLAGLLTDDHEGAPLLALTPGKAISLGGDYLVSLTVDRGARSQDIQVKLVVQRPAAAANPDASIILYDQAQHPLRRISASFPHVDEGGPFISLVSTVGCDREPAFARIILGPGELPVAAH